MSKRPVILVMSGRFDPVTNMHLHTMEAAKDWMNELEGFEVVKGYLSPTVRGIASVAERVEMCEVACRSSDWLTVDKHQAEQQSEMNPFDLLKYFVSNQGRAKSMLVIGSQSLEIYASFAQGIDRLLPKSGLVIVCQPGTKIMNIIHNHAELVKQKGNIYIVPDVVENDTSMVSLCARCNITRRQSARYLVPDDVIDLINERALYTNAAQPQA